LANALAFVHAYRKLRRISRRRGSGAASCRLVLTHPQRARALLLPVLVTYLAAALTKGVVEQGLRGQPPRARLCAGIFAGFVALPLEAAAATMKWTVPHGAPASTRRDRRPWFGGANPARRAVVAARHAVLRHLQAARPHRRRPVRDRGLFVVMLFLPRFAEFLLKLA
jgi:hypothetical protein